MNRPNFLRRPVAARNGGWAHIPDWQVVMFSGLALLIIWAKGISRLIAAWLNLPADPCHFHTRPASPVVERYFLDYPGGHIEPEGNLFTLASVLLTGCLFGICIVCGRRILSRKKY